MSVVSFTMSDWAKVCRAFNLNLTDVMSVLGSKAPVRREVRRAAPVRATVTSVVEAVQACDHEQGDEAHVYLNLPAVRNAFNSASGKPAAKAAPAAAVAAAMHGARPCNA